MFESMIFLKIAAILFLFLTLALSIIVVNFFKLQKRGWNFADIAFPLFAFEFYLISDKAYYSSLIPHLTSHCQHLPSVFVSSSCFKKDSLTTNDFSKYFGELALS